MDVQTETNDKPPQSLEADTLLLSSPTADDSSDDDILLSNQKTVVVKKTFPNKTSYLDNDDHQNCSIGNEIMIGVFVYMKSFGGWDSAMGHKKKTLFLEKAHTHIFTEQGRPCKQ